MKRLIFLIGIAALVVIGVAAIRDETGTVRYRNGAVLSYDSQTTIKDEDGGWTINNAQLKLLSKHVQDGLTHSNILTSIPTLSKGDAYLWSSNGVLYAICSDSAGTLTTNKLAP